MWKISCTKNKNDPRTKIPATAFIYFIPRINDIKIIGEKMNENGEKLKNKLNPKEIYFLQNISIIKLKDF